MKFRPGDEVTAVYNLQPDRYVLLLRVTRVGRKYLHGVTLWVDQGGAIREGHETKVPLKESIIYSGLRTDLREAEHQYRKTRQQWNNQREKVRRDAEWELRGLVQDALDMWEAENPAPRRTEFPAPEAED